MASSGQNPSIYSKDLSKKYPGTSTFAIKNINLAVYPGEVYGFLGPNGAGKSTTIKTILNFIHPTSGNAKVLGKDSRKKSVEIKKSVGYLSGDLPMYDKMTGNQFLDYMNELQAADSKKYFDELKKRLGTQEKKKLGDLSRGNKQKIAIVQAFMHKPDVLILDEPTSGLDPLKQEVFFELVREAKSRGATIFMSSHILSEVQKVCDRVGIIKEGLLIKEYKISELEDRMSQTFDITFNDKKPPKSELKIIDGLEITNVEEKSITVHMKGKLSPLLLLLSKYDVKKIDAKSLDLEDMFMHFYSDKEKK